MDSNGSKDWRSSFASRNNIVYADIPHVPLFVEDIQGYVSVEDFELNSIKKIQTVGELVSRTEGHGILVSLTDPNKTPLPINFTSLDVKDLYIENSDNTYCAVWEKYTSFKVYGNLRKEDSGPVLEATHLVPVHDIESTLKLMKGLFKIARTEYRHYYRTREQTNMLKLQWDKLKKEGKRRI